MTDSYPTLRADSVRDAHCRIGRIRFKRRTRYRSPQAFDLMTDKLRRARPDYDVRGRG